MKMVVFGSSGGCGQQLVKLALRRGHAVTATVRPGSRWQVPAGVKLLEGQLDDAAFLREAVRGQEVVLSAVGLRLPGLLPWKKPEVPDLLSRFTPLLVEAMQAEGVRRAVVISAGGVGDSFPKMPGAFQAFIRGTALRHAYSELEEMERVLAASGLDVTVCRPTGLTDGQRTWKVKEASALSGRATISREDVAGWMLDEAEQPRFVGQAPVITVTGAAA
jgi:putative NADH-flavin reductase